MTIEEKAKAYDEALERARQFANKELFAECNGHLVQYIFPELAESEEEKIRKEIIYHIQHCDDTIDEVAEKRMLAWLEKQGKKSTIIDVDKMVMKYAQTKDGDFGLPVNCMIGAYRKGINDALRLSLNLEKQGEQKHADKDEPKFKVGDWVVNNVCLPIQIASIEDDMYICTEGDALSISFIDENFHLWTIQDAKDGDVLVVGDEDGTGIAICSKNDKIGNNILYCYYDDENGFAINTPIALECLLYPATKEQRDLLFSKMKEAGYKWDAEKKELKKIEQKPVEDINGEDYGIDGLWHAIRILEQTLGAVEGYQSDDGILEHECAISAVKKLYEQNPAWSEEDDKILDSIIEDVRYIGDFPDYPTKEESELYDECLAKAEWLKSLKERYTWKGGF